MMMKVENELDIYEVNGQKLNACNNEAAKLCVRSHNTYNDRVELEIAGAKVTVIARDLENAIRNATNWK